MRPNPRLTHGLAGCPRCSTQLVAPFAAAGKPARCKACGQRFVLPSADALFEDAVHYVLEHEEAEEPCALEPTVRAIHRELILDTHTQ